MTQTILKRTKVKARHILRGEAIGLYGLLEQASTCLLMVDRRRDRRLIDNLAAEKFGFGRGVFATLGGTLASHEGKKAPSKA